MADVVSANMVYEEDTPRCHDLGIAICETFVVNKVCFYSVGDLLDDESCSLRTICVGYTRSIRGNPRQV